MIVRNVAEARFVEAMREARRAGVGYGWMRQMIGFEWKLVDPVGYIDDNRIREDERARIEEGKP